MSGTMRASPGEISELDESCGVWKGEGELPAVSLVTAAIALVGVRIEPVGMVRVSRTVRILAASFPG